MNIATYYAQTADGTVRTTHHDVLEALDQMRRFGLGATVYRDTGERLATCVPRVALHQINTAPCPRSLRGQ